MTGRPGAASSFVAIHGAHLMLLLVWLVCFAAAYVWNRRRATSTRRSRPPRPARGGMLWATALASATAGAVHLAVTPEHFAESALYGWFFVTLATAQLGWSVGVLRRPSRHLLLAGATAAAAVALLWLATRTVGIPLGPAAGEVEPAGVADVLASVAEVLTVLGAAACLRAATPAWTRSRRARSSPATS